MLPSFPSLRERNLQTLYGDTKVSTYTDVDKSPIGCVDRKVRPLVDLINSHPEYVTLSSCSGRIALFDPSGTAHDDVDLVKGTEISGKGRGTWIYVTHDIEPDLGHQIIHALNKVGQERLIASSAEKKNKGDNNDEPPITFKHEPPLLHIGAASLEAGKKLLHIAKSICAIRESGLVVTDQRVTVELRTTGTLLCLPIMVQTSSSNSKEEELSKSVSLIPSEDYIKSLADMANERMVQNEVLLDKLYHTVQNELFENISNMKVSTNNGSIGDDTNQKYNISLQSLPPLNLWKSAAVVIPRNIDSTNVDLIAFGGQGIGPEMISNNNGTSKRWDKIFRLRRINGLWCECWDTLTTDPSHESEEIQLETSTGRFRVKQEASIGPREGHCACVMPSSNSQSNTNSAAVLIFGGRTSGPLSPTNDLFLCAFTQSDEENDQSICLGRPLDIVGEPPQPRFGHTMLVLNNRNHLAVIAGGTGVNDDGKSVSLSSVYTLSHMNLLNNESAGSHFIWDRISDMPSPRSYHTAFIEETSNYMFVFGGLKEADDPFGSSDDDSSNMMMIQLPFSGKSNNIMNIYEPLPSLIGSSTLKLDDLLLVVGGTNATTLSDAAEKDKQRPISIFTKEQDENKLARANISSVELLKQDEHSSGNIDLGSCVHHCLLALPKDDDSITSAVVVGGGVPSFSFGQSYAKSYVINVLRGDASKVTEIIPKLAQLSMEPTETMVSSNNKQEKEITGKTLTKTDVVLVEARRAKEVKNELDRLGFLDKRYKMVKVEDSNRLAIPITEQFNVEASLSLKDMVVRVGLEMVPFSSSYMSKIKQKR